MEKIIKGIYMAGLAFMLLVGYAKVKAANDNPMPTQGLDCMAATAIYQEQGGFDSLLEVLGECPTKEFGKRVFGGYDGPPND